MSADMDEFNAELDRTIARAFRTGARAMQSRIARYLQTNGRPMLALEVLKIETPTMETIVAEIEAFNGENVKVAP